MFKLLRKKSKKEMRRVENSALLKDFLYLCIIFIFGSLAACAGDFRRKVFYRTTDYFSKHISKCFFFTTLRYSSI